MVEEGMEGTLLFNFLLTTHVIDVLLIDVDSVYHFRVRSAL
jgi:hypothetical protein